MENHEIARIFEKIAEILKIKGENPFRIRAYQRAALNIEGLPKNIEDLSHEELLEIPGIGEDLATKIDEYNKTGKIDLHEKLKHEIPDGLVSILSVPGLGPKTARMIYDKLKIKNIEDLERLAHEHKLSGLPGIKEKTEENILKGIAMLKRGVERQPLANVLPIADDILGNLLNNAPVSSIAIAGSLRRWKDTIKDIDIVAMSNDPQKVMDIFVNLPNVEAILMQGTTKSSIITYKGLQVDLRVVGKESYGAALAYFTGSKAHNIKLRGIALKLGLKLNEYGLFREKDDKLIAGETEEEIYKALGLRYVPPELREDLGEIEAAQAGNLPDLVRIEDIRGDLHVHSKWSDGGHTFEQLVDAAKKRGYSYFALTDHTKSLGIARGLTVERLMDQNNQIRTLNKKLKGFTVLHGTEVDILTDGSLDLPDEALKQLDIVVASIHSGFKQSREQLTERMTAAMRNPYVSIIAHPSGRLIGKREPYELDMDEVLKVARETGTALEINAYPLRLDLIDVYVKRAKGMGIPVAISTDAHVLSEFDFMGHGVAVARRGWLEKKDVLNTLGRDELMKRIKPFRK